MPNFNVFVEAAAKSLSGNKAYAFVFFLLFPLLVWVGSRAEQWVGLAFALAVAVVAVAVVALVERGSPRPESTSAFEMPVVATSDYGGPLQAIIDNVKKGASVLHPSFKKAVLAKLQDMRASDWASGTLTARKDYNDLLVDVYKNARNSVFSTSMPSYLGNWRTPLGQRILDAHKQARAAVKRVFVFDRFGEVDDGVLRLLQEHQQTENVSVYAYFDEEDDAFNFSPELTRDFTVVDDGEAIGVTQSFGPDALSALWCFGNENKKAAYQGYSQKLLERSVPLSAVVTRFQRSAGG